MASLKSTRSAPPRVLDKYVASIKTLNNKAPDSIPDSSFAEGDYIFLASDANWDYTHLRSAYSNIVSIGFDVKINGITYNSFTVAAAGWMVLRDPASTSVNISPDVISGVRYQNGGIRSQFLSYNHILLAPWFDESIPAARNVASLQNYYYNSTITSTVADDISAGKNTLNWPFDSFDHGIRCKRLAATDYGKCLLVRWTSSQQGYKEKTKFEIAIFENGRIEFRYWPLEKYEPGDYTVYSQEDATAGIFWSGATIGPNKFRDFAPFLNYSRERVLSKFGAAEYDASYSEQDPSETGNTTPFSTQMSVSGNWPRRGAVITFAPPVNTGKFLPRKIAKDMSNTRQIIRSPGLFDDRKTVNFYSGSTVVNMPSTLPSRVIGNTGNIDLSLRQLLFTSGSMEVVGSVRKHAVDTLLQQLDTIENTEKKSDYSFNEYQKNYATTSSTSAFYTDGSSVELFGRGFKAPLKSKTQFVFSLPVTKSTLLSATAPSVCYYDIELKRWAAINDSNYPPPLPSTSPRRAKSWYPISETSRGFDAVGRKIVSGTIGISKDGIFQSDAVIGSIFNVAKSDNDSINIVNSAMTKEAGYGQSLTDYSAFYPQKSQMLSFSGLQNPFLIEKIVVDLPLYADGNWFDDFTACTRAYGNTGTEANMPVGPIDFGGPALTFALACPRKQGEKSYIDIIASGTITHTGDYGSNVSVRRVDGRYCRISPIGFLSFSTPTAVIEKDPSGKFEGNVRLEMVSSIAGGLILAREDRSIFTGSASKIATNQAAVTNLLTSPSSSFRGESIFNTNDFWVGGTTAPSDSDYANKSPRIHIQQVSPLSRGTSRFEFNGNAILGGNIASPSSVETIKNPLYIGKSISSVASSLSSVNYAFDAVSLYSNINSRPSPYLVYPNDKLLLILTKTRPVVDIAQKTDNPGLPNGDTYGTYTLSGDHSTVMLNTGSINITVYGSYVRGGTEYNP